MAAYAALVSLINDLELIPNHPTHSFSFDNKKITSLWQNALFLVDFLDRYDYHGHNKEAAEDLERRIASAAHEAHDVIKTRVVDQIEAGSTLPRKGIQYYTTIFHAIKRKAMRFGPALCRRQRRPRFFYGLRGTERVDYVTREVTRLIEGSGLTMEHPAYSAPSTSTEPPPSMQFKPKSGLTAEQPSYSAPSTSSEPPASKKNVMVGSDSVVHRLLNKLTGEPSNQRLIIPIVGMGGIGKTTLAKHVYEDSLIKHHFDVRLWATISQQYSAETILAQLVSGMTYTNANASELGEGLHKMLYGRRYLIVLDDIWSADAWERVRMFLPDNSNGSRVVVTTRLSNLAASFMSSSPLEMDLLDEENSWELFCGNTFGGEDCPIEFEVIGKKIVQRCKGLPLSIVVIGGHLKRSTRVIEYWKKVSTLMNPVWSIGADKQCLNILSLSYRHLPPCLKPCFLYMGVFKEDEQINASKLIRIWVAEGFVRPKTGQTLEKVAEDYLNDLIERNLILVGERKWNGKVESCVVHDVLRGLCLRIGKEEKFMPVLGATEAMDREHRRNVITQGSLESLDLDAVGDLESSPELSSFSPKGLGFFDEWPVNFPPKGHLIVSADANNITLKEDGICFPTAHSRQLNLRYLAFSSKRLTTTVHFIERPSLPSSISLFWNLQTLAIDNFDVQICAPYEIWEMSQLRHLQFRGVYLPDPLPGDRRSNLRKCIVLENLLTLVGVENLRLTKEVCKRMPNIKELSVFYDRFPDGCDASSYYCPHNLGHFSKLESLKCEFGNDSMFREDSKWRLVVQNFTFPASLEELCLWNSNIHWEDLTGMMKSLPHLRSLKLNSVRGPEWDLGDQESSHLRVLWISMCDDLMAWNANSSHFPVLEILRVWTMPSLIEIPIDIGEIPTLRLIELYHCSVSAAVSAMRLVMEQESCGNLDIQLELHFRETEEVDSLLKTVDEEDLQISSLQLHLP